MVAASEAEAGRPFGNLECANRPALAAVHMDLAVSNINVSSRVGDNGCSSTVYEEVRGQSLAGTKLPNICASVIFADNIVPVSRRKRGQLRALQKRAPSTASHDGGSGVGSVEVAAVFRDQAAAPGRVAAGPIHVPSVLKHPLQLDKLIMKSDWQEKHRAGEGGVPLADR